MGSREHAWLRSELPQLVAEGVLTAETAESLRRRYELAGADDEPRTAWGQVVVAGFGALLVGGGVCLILAHNWDLLSRTARAALAVGGLVAVQALAVFAVARRERSAGWSESTSALLVVSVGIALALVSQTYHIPGDLGSFYRTWLWLVVAVPYLTRSVLASVLFWALLAARSFGQFAPWHSRDSPTVEPWLLVAAGLPFVVLAVRRRGASWSTALVAWASAISIFVLGIVAATSSKWAGLWAVFAVAFLAALGAVAAWPPGSEHDEPWRRRVGGPAATGLLVTGLILSFAQLWDRVGVRGVPGAVPVAVVALLCIALASVLAARLWASHVRHAALWAAGAPLVALVHLVALGGNEELPWIAVNVWLVIAGIATLAYGIRENRFGPANHGLAALAILLGARFFDVEASFLARGIAFVLLGTACFAVNLVMIWRARRKTS